VVEAGEQQQQAGRAEENGPSGSGLVLVVDDDVHVRQFAAAALQELGYEILEAQDGPSALLLLERYQPLVVLMDYAMPGMSGADAAERIRALQPGLPILFMTGHADMAAIERVARTQIHVLRKPFGISTLAEAMRAILRTRGAASQSTRGTRH
jgi:CheY-like chemotaxis protein